MVFPKRSLGTFSCDTFLVSRHVIVTDRLPTCQRAKTQRRVAARIAGEFLFFQQSWFNGKWPPWRRRATFTGGSVWVMRGTVGIHGATHGGMNCKQNQLGIFWVFGCKVFFDLPKFSTEMLEMLKGSLEMLVGFLGHKQLCVLDLFFLACWLTCTVFGRFLCTDYSLQGFHFRVGTSIPVIYIYIYIYLVTPPKIYLSHFLTVFSV